MKSVALKKTSSLKVVHKLYMQLHNHEHHSTQLYLIPATKIFCHIQRGNGVYAKSAAEKYSNQKHSVLHVDFRWVTLQAEC